MAAFVAGALKDYGIKLKYLSLMVMKSSKKMRIAIGLRPPYAIAQ